MTDLPQPSPRVTILRAVALVLAAFVFLSLSAAEPPVAVLLARSQVRPPLGAEVELAPGSPIAQARDRALAGAMADKRLRAAPTGALAKVKAGLSELRARVAAEAMARQATPGLAAGGSLLQLQDVSQPQISRVAADGAIHVYVHTKADPGATVDALKALGMTVETTAPSVRIIQGWLAYDRLEAAASLDAVEKITLPDYAVRRTGSVTSQGDSLLKANLVRQLGSPGPYTGAGIKVGIISDGVTHRSTAIASGDLPSNIIINSAMPGSGDEGTAMAEIVYDLAPGAQIFFAGPSTSVEMVTAIQWMVDQGCQVICDDVGFYAQPYFQDGTIAIAARNAVVNSGRVYVTAAGNDALDHYQGLFTDGGNNVHDFKVGSGIDTGLDISVPAGATVAVFLQWNDPFGASGNDYDLYLYDPVAQVFVAGSEGTQDGNDDPLEAVSWTNTGSSSKTLLAVIHRYSGAAKTLELFVLGGFVVDDDAVAVDSIFGHAAVSEVISTGTFNATDASFSIASYSSRGPSTIEFPTAAARPTPFITGVDGVSVTGAGGFPTAFYGTSASAPHIAAICALMLERNSLATPAQVQALISATALDKGTAGFDSNFGYGVADALSAVNQMPTAITLQPIDQVVISGNGAMFSVDVVTTPVRPTYKWQRQTAGTTGFVDIPFGIFGFSGMTDPQFSIFSVTSAMDGDRFRCIVTNGIGTVVSASAGLTVLTPPQFTSQPVGQNVAPGANVVFSAAANGTGSITYQWKKNGIALPSATGATLSLSTVGAADAGIFSVVATNVAGSLESNGVTLAISSDSFAGRPPIPTAGLTTFASNTNATKETGEPDHGGKAGGKSVWWTWTAPRTGIVTVDTIGSSFDSVLAVYTGSGFTTLAAVASDDNSGTSTGTSKLTFTATAGTTYQIAVDGAGGAAGSVVLHLEFAYHFTTFAGIAGYGTDDGFARTARFNNPDGVAVDASGNVFVADRNNHTIRKITAAGNVTTLAGLAGQSGSADGAGTAARFNSPGGVSVDGNGNIYVTDTVNCTVRKITPDGNVTTLAGLAGFIGSTDGTGSAARFRFPHSLSADSAGNVYVADSENYTIRKIVPGGAVTTIAGAAGIQGTADGTGAAARFSRPFGVSMGGAGNLLVADLDNSTIRKITGAAVVTTLAGFPGSQGTADGVGTSARFASPYGLAADGAGNAFVADASGAIRKVTAEGGVTTIAGSPYVFGSDDGAGSAARFHLPAAIAIAANGDLLIADQTGHTIRRLTSGNSVTTFAGVGSPGDLDAKGSAARFDQPTAIAFDVAGNLFVADARNSTIRKIAPDGSATTLAGLPGVVGSADGTGSAACFDHPSGVAADNNGNVFVVDTNNNTIRKITGAGVVTTLAGAPNTSGNTDGTGSAARFNNPYGVVVDAQGNLFVADHGTVRKITPGGVVTTIGVGFGSGFGPQAVAIDAFGTLYIAVGGKISKRTATGSWLAITGIAGLGYADGPAATALFYNISGLCVDGDGNLLIADTGNQVIRKMTTGGIVTTAGGVAGQIGSADGTGAVARFRSPWGIAIDANHNVFIGDSDNNTIRKAVPSQLPQIQTQPVSQTALVGASIVLSVSATAGTTVSYQWRKDGNAIAGATTASLMLTTAQTTDSGAYDVLVMTEGGIVGSSTATITITNPPPTITGQPASRSVGAGGTATLQVIASSQGTLSYQWRKGGVAISGATNATLTFSAVAASDGDVYDVNVSNGGGSVLSASAILTVLPNPLSFSSRQFIGPAGATAYFAIEGTQTKHLLLRAVGPTLANFAVSNPLADPQITVTDANGTLVASNDNWGSVTNVDWAALFNRVGASALNAGSADAALYATLAPGSYQARITGVAGATGVALLELFDTDTNSATRVAYLGVRSGVSAANGGLNSGLTVTNSASKRLLLRAVGPTLGDSAAAADPQLQILDGSTVFATNDNWGNNAALTSAASQAGAFALDPSSADAAVFVNTRIGTGTYTAVVPSTGVGGDVLLEIFDLNATGTPAYPPLVVVHPQPKSLSAGNPVTLRSLGVGLSGATYQWSKDGHDIAGATTTTLAFIGQTTDTGVYHLRITTPFGSATSGEAAVLVSPAVLAGTNSVVGPGYFAGANATAMIANTFTYPPTTTGLTWSVTLPSGWSYASSAGNAGDVRPTVGATGTVTWSWSNLPSLPVAFTYTLNVPATESGGKNIDASLTAQLSGASNQTVNIAPAPLVVKQIVTHSADTNLDSRISLVEVTRMIELYNTRNGSTRTGCYAVATVATEDGFAGAASRAIDAAVTLTRYHLADSDRNGRIDLAELTRVIALYNYRVGNLRTGQYHLQAGTEDGFAPGP